MMTNLFSTFDPSTSLFNLSINWSSTIMGMFLLPSMFWILPSRNSLFWNKLMLKIHQEFKTLTGNKHYGMTLMFISLFIMMMFNNFMGLFPYIFTSTSHMVMTFSIALPMWMSFMLFGWINNTTHMLTHLVPQGTPKLLMPFMVMIETISNIIRPGTLAVRLAANMIAGHMMLTLLGNSGTMIKFNLLSMVIIAQMLLMMLESAVTLIQAYVFSILSTLYASETY
uniref:ATP synthase subunit a n=1 Tax=Atractomorpha psittacina TaxID=1920482 RepID=A0A6G6A7N1_9ORTH|nr:ATP synthase F0 subunit 6 [Atractomorpha psittacina]YP_010987347.1 ATP synthase F0 subunit 6 [Atractomorpha lata]QID03854.1 ATP synthase F0 subunit 6 [Atractomorpha psittacina]WOL43048.1 ATP synthase F0 subunit 6 [Atractomorpha lata]